MKYPVRKNLRLSQYDYSQVGYYFVTICCKNTPFGRVSTGQMQLSDQGEVAREYWSRIPAMYPQVSIDEFVIMPNHMHGIIVIENNQYNNHVGANNVRPYGLLSRIIKMYKWVVTKTIHERFGHDQFQWQRSFHDHIIRNENDLNHIREYIHNNPADWERDKIM